MSELSSAQFREMLRSGDVKTGKKGRLSFSEKSGNAIGHLLEQEHVRENDRSLKALKSKKVKVPRKEAPELGEMKLWLTALNIPFKSEHPFSTKRKFRFDIALLEYKVAIEYEGIFGGTSGHTTLGGYIKDCEKYNLATVLGWRVLRYTSNNYKMMLEDVELLIKSLNS